MLYKTNKLNHPFSRIRNHIILDLFEIMEDLARDNNNNRCIYYKVLLKIEL